MSDIAVIFGGPSPEHDVSVLTGLQAAHELQREPVTPWQALYWSKRAEWFAVDAGARAVGIYRRHAQGGAGPAPGSGAGGRVRSITAAASRNRRRRMRVAVVVVCCHGGPGEDGTLQAALDGGGRVHRARGGGRRWDGQAGLRGLMAAAGLPRCLGCALV